MAGKSYTIIVKFSDTMLTISIPGGYYLGESSPPFYKIISSPPFYKIINRLHTAFFKVIILCVCCFYDATVYKAKDKNKVQNKDLLPPRTYLLQFYKTF